MTAQVYDLEEERSRRELAKAKPAQANGYRELDFLLFAYDDSPFDFSALTTPQSDS